MYILHLKETSGLLFSVLSSIVVNYSSLYLGNTAQSWSLIGFTFFIIKKPITEKDVPWSKRGFHSFTIYVGRLLKENLYFKVNDINKPKMRFNTYFFICNMVFDIILHTLFIFLAHLTFYVYFLVGCGIFKIFALISVSEYHRILDFYYYKKEQKNWQLRENSIRKIKESNPHFFDLYDPIIWERFLPQFSEFTTKSGKRKRK